MSANADKKNMKEVVERLEEENAKLKGELSELETKMNKDILLAEVTVFRECCCRWYQNFSVLDTLTFIKERCDNERVIKEVFDASEYPFYLSADGKPKNCDNEDSSDDE